MPTPRRNIRVISAAIVFKHRQVRARADAHAKIGLCCALPTIGFVMLHSSLARISRIDSVRG